MLKLLLSGSIILILIFLLAGNAWAHPLDQTITEVFLVTDDKRNVLAEKTIFAKIFVTWQQLSYIHDQAAGAIKDEDHEHGEDAFDVHIKGILANPTAHRNYISESMEFKAEGEDCDISQITEAKFDKKEALLGKGVEINLKVSCPTTTEKGVSVVNRMLMDEFPYQKHLVRVYLYNRLVAEQTLDINQLELVYPKPSPTPSPSKMPNMKKERGNKIGWWIGGMLVGLTYWIVKKQ